MYQADTVYDFNQHPWWSNANDRVAYQRAFSEGNDAVKRETQALISQSPLTPRSEIRNNMTVKGVPSRAGYNPEELTIKDVLNVDYTPTNARANTSLWNDFSGSNSETNATVRPGGSWW
jgi:hypothetical protein